LVFDLDLLDIGPAARQALRNNDPSSAGRNGRLNDPTCPDDSVRGELPGVSIFNRGQSKGQFYRLVCRIRGRPVRAQLDYIRHKVGVGTGAKRDGNCSRQFPGSERKHWVNSLTGARESPPADRKRKSRRATTRFPELDDLEKESTS